MAFQYPVEIPGVSNQFFLQRHLMQCAAIAARKRSTALILGFDGRENRSPEDAGRFINPSVNVGFSGGEKKRNDILQMACWNRSYAFLMSRTPGWILTHKSGCRWRELAA